MIKKYLFKKWPFKDKSIYPGLTKKWSNYIKTCLAQIRSIKMDSALTMLDPFFYLFI